MERTSLGGQYTHTRKFGTTFTLGELSKSLQFKMEERDVTRILDVRLLLVIRAPSRPSQRAQICSDVLDVLESQIREECLYSFAYH